LIKRNEKVTTISDVAKEANVSTATVSRVINGSSRINANTEKRVLDAMAKLNYSPNTIARSLAKGHNDCIGFLLPDLNMPFWAKLAHEVEKCAKSHGWNVMISSAPKNLDDYCSAYNRLSGSMVSGIITTYIGGTADFISESKTPTVTISSISECSYSVSSNDEQGGIFATRHLISRGCRKIIHISGEMLPERSSNARTHAFVKECERHGIAYKLYETSLVDQVENDYAGVIGNVFYENTDFDGIFASNDILASMCLSTALSLGYRVPQDIKIVGYDDIPISAMIYPPLTTIRQDYQKLSSLAVETVLNLINGVEVPKKQQIPVELIVRGTT
jgi:LacI family sucrose operon transcriptional repressor